MMSDINDNIIGIDEDLSVSEGYDSMLDDATYINFSECDWKEEEDVNLFTFEERQELGALMIGRWRAYIDRVNFNKT